MQVFANGKEHFHSFIEFYVIHQNSETSNLIEGCMLTGVLAQLLMVWWDRQMVKKTGTELRVYKRYSDDINVI